MSLIATLRPIGKARTAFTGSARKAKTLSTGAPI